MLQARVVRARAEQRDVLRARIVLAASGKDLNASIAGRLGVTVDTVRKWRGRFATRCPRLESLQDLAGSGWPRVFAPVVAAQVKAIACSLPAEQGLPISAWTCAEIAQEAVERGVVGALSASTVRRILDEDVIKPWQCRSWIFPRDPDFGPKAGRVLDLHARRWHGRRLRDDEYVISANEKSQLQALRRIYPDLPPGPGQPCRQDLEYQRGGTLAYFAALDAHLGQVIGRCAPKTGIEPFGELVGAEHRPNGAQASADAPLPATRRRAAGGRGGRPPSRRASPSFASDSQGATARGHGHRRTQPPAPRRRQRALAYRDTTTSDITSNDRMTTRHTVASLVDLDSAVLIVAVGSAATEILAGAQARHVPGRHRPRALRDGRRQSVRIMGVGRTDAPPRPSA